MSEARAVKREIDSLIYENTDKKLTEVHKQQIIEQVRNELGFPLRDLNERFAVNASNDDFTDMTDTIENILKGRN